MVTIRPHLLAALLTLIGLGALWSRDRPQGLDRYDQPFYLGIAHDLRHEHRFTDGFRFAGGDQATVRPSGMRFTPLYPALLAGAAWLDPGFGRATDCLVAHYATDPGVCPRDAGPVRTIQFLMAAAIFWMLWWSAWRCAGRQRAGWIALAVSVPSMSVVLLSVDYLMTETPSLFLVVAAQALALRATLGGRRLAWAMASGLALGLAALSRPAFELLAVAAVLVAMGLAWRARAGGRAVLGFAAGIALAVGPWIARNALVMHRASLSFGYASHTLVQRLSFDSMSWREYGLSFACWMPDGNGIGGLIAGRHACDRFGWDDHPDSFYAIGIGPMLERTLRAAGGWGHHMGYLLRHTLLADPMRQIGWHLAVSLPLGLRGVAIAHWWGFVLAIVCAAVTVRALRNRGVVARRFLLLALPGWFMLALNAGIAVNQVRYNLMLLLPFSVAAALAIEAPRRG